MKEKIKQLNDLSAKKQALGNEISNYFENNFNVRFVCSDLSLTLNNEFYTTRKWSWDEQFSKIEERGCSGMPSTKEEMMEAWETKIKAKEEIEKAREYFLSCIEEK